MEPQGLGLRHRVHGSGGRSLERKPFLDGFLTSLPREPGDLDASLEAGRGEEVRLWQGGTPQVTHSLLKTPEVKTFGSTNRPC